MKPLPRTRPSPSTGTGDGWSEEATFTLIDAWGKLYKTLNPRNLRQYHWKDVAKAVNDNHAFGRKARRTFDQCKSRINALRKRYATEKARVSDSGDYDNAWPFFDKISSVIGDPLPVRKLSPPSVTPVRASAWALAPVGRRSRTQSQSSLKRPAPGMTSTSESLDESRFNRNLAAFAAAAAAAAEEEIDDSNSDNSDSDEWELSNESQKRNRGRNDMELGHREVASAAKKFSEIHERVNTQIKNVALEKQKMQFSKDSQRMQLRKSTHSKHMDDLLAHSKSGLDTQSTNRKRKRGPTQMKKLAVIDGQKIPIEFDQLTGKPLGENKTKFKSYLGFLSRSKISILINEWDSVDEDVKDDIWTTILEVWDVPNSGFLRKKLMSYVGERWRGFKTILTSKYVHGEYSDKSPLEVYSFLNEEIWEAFVQSRLDPSFQEIRKKAQISSFLNKHPHRLSRGGYELLQEKIMQEKSKQKDESLGDSVAAPPSPPTRHEQWKKARQNASGDYITEDTRIVAEKIDSLVEKASQGAFVPQGRKDILAEAIGRPDHSGGVRGVGRGVGIRQYFGPQSREASTPSVFSSQQIEAIKVELTQQIREQLMQDLSSMGFSKNIPASSPNTIVPASPKGSHSIEPPITEEDEIPKQCELYVDNLIHAVAFGNVYKLGPTIHNQMLENDMVRVVVNEVLDANAQVPMPTDEVETVGHALNNFIQWPKRLVQIISDKDADGSGEEDVSAKSLDPKLDSVQQLVLKAMCMSESIKLELEHERMKFLWLSQRDIMELCMGKQELSITILRLWLTYLNRLSINMGKSDLYGFIDPCFIQSPHDPTKAETYIQNKLYDDKKECYLAPYHNNRQWQLLIVCPKKNNVVFLCSKERKPDNNIVRTIDTALDGYHKRQGVQKKKPTWNVPVCQRQPGTYESGYYIMIHMLNIVSDGIIDPWKKKVFGNSEPFHEDELINVRQRFASFILEYML
ncbi:uncharacterized protein LOC131653803 [Vicia villosa]|uniref:uncharacterized protein LOC131653801 n=1 Tax=Vicia villosa TaxID=3911 RepID=UPI00273B5C2E|nr:uncharacterized protein LOC131653801 [Vicia villosa]XP_058780071.1 uncharacterized protein LOC131653803 [Vicia villosa]